MYHWKSREDFAVNETPFLYVQTHREIGKITTRWLRSTDRDRHYYFLHGDDETLWFTKLEWDFGTRKLKRAVIAGQ